MSNKDSIKVIPLGGLGEIGKNITAFEYENEIVIIDCGISFPDEEMYGVDLVIPDITYLLNNKDKVKAIFLTHGHEDHIGSLPYILQQLNRPVYGTALTLAIAIHTPVGVILHTGDFKIDYTPIDGLVMDFHRIAELGKKGVLLLMADSTNVQRKGHTISEKSIGETLTKIFSNAKGRVIVATFASNIHRMQQIVDASIEYGRKVAFSGRSMEIYLR